MHGSFRLAVPVHALHFRGVRNGMPAAASKGGWRICRTETGPGVARRRPGRPGQKGKAMVPLVSVVGCLLLAFGLWGSIVSLRRDGPRF